MWPHTIQARFDGVVPMAEDRPLSPAEIRHIVSCIHTYREHDRPVMWPSGSPVSKGSSSPTCCQPGPGPEPSGG